MHEHFPIRWTERHTDDGYTMVELMIVVLVIAVLIAIALPVMAGARERAMDRRVQADIRNAFLAEKAYYTDALAYTDLPAEMTAIEAAMDYEAGDTPLEAGKVYLLWRPASNEIFISAKTDLGNCFYLAEASASGAEYATAADPACGAADAQTYGQAW
jgi:type IV pilus assembly protein PilA